jgi:hypothetical protein
MMRDEFIVKALSLPADADVVIELSPRMRADIADIRYDEDRQSIVIVPQPDDAREAFRKFFERAVAEGSGTGCGSVTGSCDGQRGCRMNCKVP